MITVIIGQAARRAAIARTGVDPGMQISLDFSAATTEAKAALARYYDVAHECVSVEDATDATLEAVCAALLARAQADDARAAAEQAAREQLAADAREHARLALARPVEDWVDGQRVRMPVPPGYYQTHYPEYQRALQTVEGYAERVREAKRIIEERAEAERREREARIAAEDAARAAAQAAEQAYCDEWVAAHADEATREQYRDGLLSREDLLEAIKEWACSGLPPEHTVNTCDDRACPCGITRVTTLPREVYAAWKEIKAGLPESVTWEFERARDHDGEQPYYTALLHVPAGPFRFARCVKIA